MTAAGFLLLGTIAIHGPFGASLIEAKVAETARKALSEAGHDWAQPAANGRTIALSGEAPNERALDAALASLAASGLARVDHAGVVVAAPNVPIDDYRFSAQWSDNSITLTGLAPSVAARDAILAPFLSDASITVIDGTNAGPIEDEASWLAAAGAALHALSMLDAGSATQQGRKFSIAGAVSNTAIADAAEGLIAGASGAFEFDLAFEPSGSAGDTLLSGQMPAQRECQSAINRALNGRRLEFAANSVELGQAEREFLDVFAEQIQICGDLTIAIEGHTDATGTQAGNLALSERRSMKVRDYLVTRSVGAALVIKAYGESRPIASNQTKAGQQRNRRIDFVVVDSDENSDSQG